MNPSPERKRVTLFFHGIAPYRVPVFERFAQLPGIQVTVVSRDRNFAWLEAHGYPLNFEHAGLDGQIFHLTNRWSERTGLSWTPSLWSYLNQHPYDVLVTLGWTMPDSILALLHAKLHRRPIILWEDSVTHPTGRFKRLLMPLLKQYIRMYDAYVAASSGCIQYLVEMGAPRERITLVPLVADNDFFQHESARHRTLQAVLKQKLHVQTRYLILFVGQLIPRKGVVPLLEAFQRVAKVRDDVSLMFVGAGRLRQEILNRRAAYGLQDRIFVENFASQDVLPMYYGLADVFVLPSVYDAFGVVVCEAMASGLPVIATRMVGATSNIVQNGVNGFVIEPGVVQPLADALLKILQDDRLRAAMGKESLRIIAEWNVELAARNFMACLSLCLNHPALPLVQASGVG